MFCILLSFLFLSSSSLVSLVYAYVSALPPRLLFLSYDERVASTRFDTLVNRASYHLRQPFRNLHSSYLTSVNHFLTDDQRHCSFDKNPEAIFTLGLLRNIR